MLSSMPLGWKAHAGLRPQEIRLYSTFAVGVPFFCPFVCECTKKNNGGGPELNKSTWNKFWQLAHRWMCLVAILKMMSVIHTFIPIIIYLLSLPTSLIKKKKANLPWISIVLKVFLILVTHFFSFTATIVGKMFHVISFLKHIYVEWILKILYYTYNARPKYRNWFKLKNVVIIYGNPDAVPVL